MERRNTGKKRNFSEMEIGILTSEVEQKKDVIFGSLENGIKGAHKIAAWQKITEAVHRVAVEEWSLAEVLIQFSIT